MKDVRPGRTVRYRRNETPEEVFQKKLNDELSGGAEIKREKELDDIWLNALRKEKDKQREPVFAFIVSAKKKEKWIPKDMDEGSFTEYCGGKVTEECIQKGKNSPNKKTKQRAELAETFREMSGKKKK